MLITINKKKKKKNNPSPNSYGIIAWKIKEIESFIAIGICLKYSAYYHT